MESSNQKVLVKVSNTSVHKISIIARKKLAHGSCEIYQQGENYFFRIHSYVHSLKEMTFGQVRYEASVSYFFREQSQSQKDFIHILSISLLDNSDELLKEFHDTLAKHSVVRQLSKQSDGSQLHKRVLQTYPQFQTKQVKNKSAITTISKQIGGFVGTISEIVVKPADKVGDIVEKKKQNFYQHNVNEKAKTKWDAVKNKASVINEKLTESMKPVSQSAKNITSKLGHNFNHSNNKFIKAVREISKRTKDALNEGYKQATAHSQKVSTQTTQTDSVMEIKVDIKQQEK